jgi:hypothetical protein
VVAVTRVPATLALVFALSAVAVDALAQCAGQPPQRFNYRVKRGIEIKYYLAPSVFWEDTNALYAVINMLDLWSRENMASGHGSYYTPSAVPPEGDGGVTISWGRPRHSSGRDCNYLECTASATPQGMVGATGFITTWHIILDPEVIYFEGVPAYGELESATAHEVGHAQGLDHTTPGVDQPLSVMTPTNTDENRAQYPTPCDIDAVKNYSLRAPREIARGGPGRGEDHFPNLCIGGGCFGFGGWSCRPGYYFDPGSGWCLLPEVKWRIYGQDFGSGLDGFNAGPLIEITWPPNGATNIPRSGTVTVNTIDIDGRVWRVDYYLLINGQWSPVSTNNIVHPFWMGYANTAPGWYTLAAVAYDDANVYGVSNVVTVFVP